MAGKAAKALQTGKEAIVYHLVPPNNQIARTAFRLGMEDQVAVSTDYIDGSGMSTTETVAEAAERLHKLLLDYHCFDPIALYDDLLESERPGVVALWDPDEFPIDWDGVQTHTLFVDGDVDPDVLAEANKKMRERDQQARATNETTVEALLEAFPTWRAHRRVGMGSPPN